MKETGIILLALLMVFCMMTNDARAGAQVYLTISVGSGLFIGVIGVCVQAVFQQRIAKDQEDLKPSAAAQFSDSKPDKPELTQRLARTEPVLPQLDLQRNVGQGVRPDFEVDFFTFRW